MLNFQVACAQKFQTINDFLHCQQIWIIVITVICKNFRKNDKLVNTV